MSKVRAHRSVEFSIADSQLNRLLVASVISLCVGAVRIRVAISTGFFLSLVTLQHFKHLRRDTE